MRSSDAPSRSRIAVASFIGTVIEFYDFYIYGTAAALVLNKLFFPSFLPPPARWPRWPRLRSASSRARSVPSCSATSATGWGASGC
jgi:hypothetical protein